MQQSVKGMVLRIAQPAVFALAALLLVLTALLQIDQPALVSMAIVVLAMVPFFLRFERSRPRPRDIVPVVVLAVIAALGRAIFVFVPNFQPVTAIVILTGIVFGPQAGFLCGALSALGSNMFLGQGPWTPWQMLCWGVIGYVAGALQRTRLFRSDWIVCAFGFVFSLLYGWALDAYYIIGFIRPVTWSSSLTVFAMSAFFDVSHAVSTVVCLALLLRPWRRKLLRIRRKFGLIGADIDEKGPA